MASTGAVCTRLIRLPIPIDRYGVQFLPRYRFGCATILSGKVEQVLSKQYHTRDSFQTPRREREGCGGGEGRVRGGVRERIRGGVGGVREEVRGRGEVEK